MRIITLKTKWVSIGSHKMGPYRPELYVEKMLFDTYKDALTARSMIRKHFGPMEIKRIKGGYALYTRTRSHYSRPRSRYFRNRRSR